MGSVYAAWDPKLHREVALKVISPTLVRDPKSRERFHREARAIAALRHPNIVEIYDYSGPASEHLYLVMEKLNGDDLFNLLGTKGVLPEAAAAAAGHELCLALEVAHRAGVIHRDIKPENVFVDPAGRVVLTDFGVVKPIRADSAVDGWSTTTEVIGTPGFMAPEAMMNRALGPRTDIFALGALLFNIATGELPFEGASPVETFRAAVAGRMTDPRKLSPELSDAFCAVLETCLEAKPKRRYRSMEEVRQALKGVLELNGVTDLRDDLRDFVRDPRAYAELAKRRAVGSLTQRLKVAVKDHDAVAASRLRSQLQVLDPGNDVAHAISGLIVRPDGRVVIEDQSHNQRRAARLRRLYIIAAVSVVAIGASVAGFLAPAHWWQSTKPAASALSPPRDVDAPPPAPETALATVPVDIDIDGGPALVTIDGRRVGLVRTKRVMLSPGRHTLEVKKKRKRLRRPITVPNEGPLRVQVDIRRNTIVAQ